MSDEQSNPEQNPPEIIPMTELEALVPDKDLYNEKSKLYWEIKELKRQRWRPWVLFVTTAAAAIVPGILILTSSLYDIKKDKLDWEQKKLSAKQEEMVIKTKEFETSSTLLRGRISNMTDSIDILKSLNTQLEKSNGELTVAFNSASEKANSKNPQAYRLILENKHLADSITKLKTNFEITLGNQGMFAARNLLAANDRFMFLSSGFERLKKENEDLKAEIETLKANQKQ